MHERVAIVLRHTCGSYVGTDELMCFFLIHGVCLVVEFLGEKKCVMGWVSACWLHWAVARPLTIGLVVVTASWLFFSPPVRNGVDVKDVEKCKVNYCEVFEGEGVMDRKVYNWDDGIYKKIKIKIKEFSFSFN